MIIKILGGGCPNCIELANNVKVALEKANMEAEIQKITDMGEILSYSIMGTPALVIDEKVVSFGKVNTVDEIMDFIN